MIAPAAKSSSRSRGSRRTLAVVVRHKHFVCAAEAILEDLGLGLSHLDAEGIAGGRLSTILRGIAIALDILGRLLLVLHLGRSLVVSKRAGLMFDVSFVFGFEHHEIVRLSI